MHRLTLLLTLMVIGLSPRVAEAQVEKSYDSGKSYAVTPWYGWIDDSSRNADLLFIKHMRPHHSGALTMSAEYLADRASSDSVLRQLAHGIMHNQEFEIRMLDSVEKNLSAVRLPENGSAVAGRIATRDLSQRYRFYRMPMPGPMDQADSQVSSKDVQFAKAMIIHHQAALDMARDYLANPHAKNGYLKLMCLDILIDQQREIDFMHSVIDRYSGNPDDVKITSSMIHGMEGMHQAGASHGHHAGH